ncbi:Golgi apparatus membrane protein TVP38, partial [Lachnellula suecica]
IIPLCIVAIVFAVLFEVYKSDFERWVKPLTDWLREREAWSWTIPVAILFILSFPPLFGHEIVQLIVGLTYPLGVALGIACAGAVLGEAGCLADGGSILFKYGFTWWVDKKIATKIKWAAVARVAQEAGFRGVLVIRYSIVPPHLANPLFACTGMAFWLYMVTVFLSLPKSLVFVALGSPGNENNKAAKWGKVVAIGVVVIITIFASWWIRKKMAAATKQIEAERAGTAGDDEELGMLGPQVHATESPHDTAYHGAKYQGLQQAPYQGAQDAQYGGAQYQGAELQGSQYQNSQYQGEQYHEASARRAM